MPIVSTRIDESTKSEADEIADNIGISLSTAINVFLKRFVKEKGFPFAVVATEDKAKPASPIVNVEELDAAVEQAIAAPNNNIGLSSNKVTYLDPKTNEFKTIS